MSKTKNQIIEEIYNDPSYDQMLKNIAKDKQNLVDELKQELFLTLLEKPEELIQHLYNKKEMKWYATRILLAMINSNTSPFYKKYRKEELEKTMEYNLLEYNVEDVDVKQDTYKSFDIFQYAIENNILSWYEQELFNLYYRINPSFLEEDISTKVTYVTIAKKLNVTKLNILHQMNKIKYKLFKSLVSEDFVPKTDTMLDFINKYETKNKK